jgi:branched-subunit amino acid transport protein
MINYMNDSTFIWIILGTMVVTYIPRMLPLVLLSKTKLPKRVEDFLDYIPIAILGAILFQTLIIRESQVDLSRDNEYLIIGVLTILFSRFVKRVDLIVLVGILLTILFRLI